MFLLGPPISYTTANRSSLSMTTLVLKGFWADVAHLLPEQSCTSNRFKRTKIHVPLRGPSHLKPLARSLWMRKRVFISPSPFQNDNAFKMTKWLNAVILTKWQMTKWLRIVVFFDQHGKYLVYPDIRYRYSFFIIKVTKCTLEQRYTLVIRADFNPFIVFPK